MLALTRKVGEIIIIQLEDGHEIEIQVVDFRSGNVRIGISARSTITINRKELHEAKKAFKK